MEYKVKAYNIWEVGQRFDEQGMPHQEDALFPAYGCCAPEDRLFILCDGMGGHDNGEIASSVVCSTIAESVIRQLRKGSGVFREGIFDTALAEAYDALDDNDTGSSRKMGTTMAMLYLYEKGYFIAHIGDTRVYHIRPGDDEGSTQIIFATTDHSLVNKLVASGKMSMEEAVASTRRHVITRAMQPRMEARPRADIEMSSDIRPGDYFVMVTNGMLDNLDDYTIKRIFSREGGTDREKFKALRSATARNRDNHSAVIVHIEKVMSPRTKQKEMAPASGRPEVKQGERTSSRPKSKVQSSGRQILNRAKCPDNMGALVRKCLLGLMLLLTLIMIVYYAFFHKDEAMLEAGWSAETPVVSEDDSSKNDEEKFGYETKFTEVIDDRVVDDGSTDSQKETVSEDTPTDDESKTETPEEQPAPEVTPDPVAPPAPDPVSQPEGPILQE